MEQVDEVVWLGLYQLEAGVVVLELRKWVVFSLEVFCPQALLWKVTIG